MIDTPGAHARNKQTNNQTLLSGIFLLVCGVLLGSYSVVLITIEHLVAREHLNGRLWHSSPHCCNLMEALPFCRAVFRIVPHSINRTSSTSGSDFDQGCVVFCVMMVTLFGVWLWPYETVLYLTYGIFCTVFNIVSFLCNYNQYNSHEKCYNIMPRKVIVVDANLIIVYIYSV